MERKKEKRKKKDYPRGEGGEGIKKGERERGGKRGEQRRERDGRGRKGFDTAKGEMRPCGRVAPLIAGFQFNNAIMRCLPLSSPPRPSISSLARYN